MNNLQKRILTSLLILPLSIFFIFKGNYFFLFFLTLILLAGMYEIFSVFKKKVNKFFLLVLLVLSVFSTHFLRGENEISVFLLYFVITICVSSDIGGYVFGKAFKWKKLTKISPNKTISGVFGSFTFSIIFGFIFNYIIFSQTNYTIGSLTALPEFLLIIIFSSVAQIGDLVISYIKRLEKIKDTGIILPGHGGIFDRIDGLMFVVILAFILFQTKI